MRHLELVQSLNNQIWDNKNLNGIDDFFATEALIHSPMKTTQGISEIKEVITLWHQAFPDLKVHWDDFICDENKVVCRWHATGQHDGHFLGHEPSKKKVNYSGITIYQLDNNKIVAYWSVVDMDTLKKQLSN